MYKPETIGFGIRVQRMKRSWSQSALAAAAGLHFNHISKIELGMIKVGLDNFTKIAEAMGMLPSELLSLCEKSETPEFGPRRVSSP